MFRFRRKAHDPYFNNPQALEELLDGDEEFHLVDVRSPPEVREGRIPGAQHIPYLEIGDRPPTEDRSALIVLYCHSGGRSETARRTLRAKGYERVYNFGGIVHWPGKLVRDDD
jgi:rhodanese-related sulfurtransferase